jgi:hypothetical protein
MFLVTPTPIVFHWGVSMFSRCPAESIHMCNINLAPPLVEPLHARFHEIDDLEIVRACGRDSWSHDKETSKRFGGSVGQTNIALHE